jgi:prepilin-type processing-associated H-X9-DG protein
MTFRLWTIFYVFALVAAAMATFGPGGVIFAALVLGFWTWTNHTEKRALRLVPALVILAIIGTLFALVIPVTPSVREAARRNQCMNNLKQLALGILNYESATGGLPPAYVKDANGTPMHSWRTLILPYLDELPLYKSYNFNEPWDGPINSTLIGQMPEVYRCPSQSDGKAGSAFETHYFAVVGPGSIFPGDKAATIRSSTDGISNTLMLIEATGLGVNWLDPRDVTVDEAVELLTTKPRSGHSHVHEGFFTTTYHETSQRNVVFIDGHVVHMGQFDDADVAKALLTIAGGETIPQELADEYKPDVVTTIVNWRNIYALSLFVVLAMLPAAWMRSLAKSTPTAQREAGELEVGLGETNVESAI